MPIEKIPESQWPKICNHPDHNPPTHIHIPYGHQLRHTCPACGREVVVRSMDVICESWVYKGRKPEEKL